MKRGFPLDLAEWTGLEPATSGVTGQHSNRLNYHSAENDQFNEGHAAVQHETAGVPAAGAVPQAARGRHPVVGTEGIEPPTRSV